MLFPYDSKRNYSASYLDFKSTQGIFFHEEVDYEAGHLGCGLFLPLVPLAMAFKVLLISRTDNNLHVSPIFLMDEVQVY